MGGSRLEEVFNRLSYIKNGNRCSHCNSHCPVFRISFLCICRYFNNTLCTANEEKKSLHAAYTRFVASIIGMLYAFLSFELFSYHPLTLAGMLIIFIPTIVSLKVADGFVSSAVIIMHIYAAEKFSWTLVSNEFALMAIGYGTGIAINMYMPDIQKELNYYRVKIEELYSKIFFRNC